MCEHLEYGFTYQAGDRKSSTWIIFSTDYPIGTLSQEVLDQLADEDRNIKEIIRSSQGDELHVRLHDTNIGLATMDLLARKLHRHCVSPLERLNREVRERRIRRHIGHAPY